MREIARKYLGEIQLRTESEGQEELDPVHDSGTSQTSTDGLQTVPALLLKERNLIHRKT